MVQNIWKVRNIGILLLRVDWLLYDAMSYMSLFFTEKKNMKIIFSFM